jgi:hypothetical protein
MIYQYEYPLPGRAVGLKGNSSVRGVGDLVFIKKGPPAQENGIDHFKPHVLVVECKSRKLQSSSIDQKNSRLGLGTHQGATLDRRRRRLQWQLNIYRCCISNFY